MKRECMWYRASTKPDSTEFEAPDKCRQKGCTGWIDSCPLKLERIECVTIEEFSRAQAQARRDRQVDAMLHEGRMIL